MKTFTFKIIDQKSIIKGLALAAIYFIVVFAISYYLFGGIWGMADKLDNMGSTKAMAFIIGIVVLTPFFLLLQLVRPKINVTINENEILIGEKNKSDVRILLNAIDKMERNISKINKLDFFDAQGTLILAINPANHQTILSEILNEITAKKEFEIHTKSEKYFGSQIEKTTYKSK